MGWYGIFNNGLMTRKENIERALSVNVLKSAMVGTTYYAACKDSRDGTVFGLVCLSRLEDGELMLKDMTENVGPCESNCPKSILDLLTPTDNEYALKWRERCRVNAGNKGLVSKFLKNIDYGKPFKVESIWGTVYEVAKQRPNYRFKGDWLKCLDDNTYLMKSKVKRIVA